MKAKLTVRAIQALEPRSSDYIVWDTEVPGFGCKVTPKGRRSFLLYYRNKDGQQRKPAIGQFGAIKPEAAREIAKRWLAEVASGGDPSKTRQQDRAAVTVSQLCDRYLVEHAETRKKATSVRNDRRLISAHVKPAFGSKKAVSIVRSDIAALHHSLRSTPYEANRALALLSKMFGLAERWGIRPDHSNPAKNIDRYKEAKRERFLSNAELHRLWQVLNSEEAMATVSASALAAVKLLILTGRRLSEVLSLKWEWIDLDMGTMRIPDTKSGALLVSLSEAATAILRELKEEAEARADCDSDNENSDDERREYNPYVITGQRKGAPLVNLQKPWRRIRALAKLDDVRLHDLRHTYASVGAGMGLSLPLLGRLLGHTQAATTSRYAHLAQDPVRIAANEIGDEILRVINR